ncbi:MAG: DUF2614 family zinc ribbon-containing protein [bacterium]|nr:DUF2614 family zinc ribbon-containing protein [bacterium]
MFDEFKNKLGKEVKGISLFSQSNNPFLQIKDIFDDDKLSQAEKRWAKFENQTLKGYNFWLFSWIPLMYSFLSLLWFIKVPGGIFSLFTGIVLFNLTVFIFYRGFNNLQKFKRLPNYFSCIADSKNGSLDEISAYLGYPYEVVVSDIEFLINKGILEKTFINHSKRVIVSPLIGEDVSKKSRSIVCPNCGATNKIIGQTTECEFCGSILTNTKEVIS